MEDNNLNQFFDTLLGKNKEANISIGNEINTNSNTSILTDKKFECNLRNVLEKNLPIKMEKENMDLLEEFKLYKMELFNRKTKELIKSNIFLAREQYYYIKMENKYFFISNDDISNLNYYDADSNKKIENIKGFEETQQVSNDSAKFFLQKKDNKEQDFKDEKQAFFDDIKLNLISKETISFIGNNNNIPEDFFENYYVRAKLLSQGDYPYSICLGKDKENKPSTGTIHYPMEKYYVKLTLRKGQFDGVYSSEREIELSELKIDVIYKTFDKIPEKSKILFEFKNGNGGEDKVLSQAVNYQENAKALLNGMTFYHIIIIRSRKLRKALENLKKRIDNEKFTNFAILCLNDKLVICGEEFKYVQNIENVKKIKALKNLKKSGSSSNNSQISDISDLSFKNYIKEKLSELEKSMTKSMTLIRKEIAALKKSDEVQ